MNKFWTGTGLTICFYQAAYGHEYFWLAAAIVIVIIALFSDYVLVVHKEKRFLPGLMVPNTMRGVAGEEIKKGDLLCIKSDGCWYRAE
jgi:ABC-type enterochelin transport system permease subunit